MHVEMAKAILFSPFADFGCFGFEVDYAWVHDEGWIRMGMDKGGYRMKRERR